MYMDDDGNGPFWVRESLGVIWLSGTHSSVHRWMGTYMIGLALHMDAAGYVAKRLGTPP